MEKEGRLPDAVIACVGGGSNAMELFMNLFPMSSPPDRLRGGGLGIDTEKHAAHLKPRDHRNLSWDEIGFLPG